MTDPFIGSRINTGEIQIFAGNVDLNEPWVIWD